jgi:hypothetical protein
MFKMKFFNNIVGNPDYRMFRNMGYFNDQSGILRRYRRERKGWDSHLMNTQKFAIETMQGRNRKSAAVLGSGWLLDVPLEEMSSYFEKLYLFDIRHPAKVKKRIKPLGNVELRVCDISCYAHSVYQYVKQYRNSRNRPPISNILPQNTLDLNDFDFVFSCNILNQLDILLIDYLSQFFDLSREETISFRKAVQHHHIEILPRNRSCMVADYKEITLMPDGKEVSRRMSVYHSVIQRKDAKRWTWEFDKKMTYYKDKMTLFEVFGVKI